MINLMTALSKLSRPSKALPFIGAAAKLDDQKQNTETSVARNLRTDLWVPEILFDSLDFINETLFFMKGSFPI